MYVVLVSLMVKPQHLETFERAILANAKASVATEAECHRFEVSQAEQDPTRWLLYEVYTNRAAFDHHHQQPHFLDYNATAAECVASKSISTYLTKT